MKYLKQFAIIMIISFIGEVLHSLLPLPVPASIYGLVIMFTLLMTKVVKHEDVKDAGHFLIDVMPIMFIPSSVGLITAFAVLKPLLVPYVVISVVSTFLVMLVAGRVTQWIIRRNVSKEEDGADL